MKPHLSKHLICSAAAGELIYSTMTNLGTFTTNCGTFIMTNCGTFTMTNCGTFRNK